MDDVRDLVLGERALDRFELGDVAGDEVDPVELLWPHDQPQSVRVGAEVEGRDRHPLVDEQPAGPGADAAERPGDEEPVAHDHPPLIPLQQFVTSAAEIAGAPRCSSAGDNTSPGYASW